MKGRCSMKISRLILLSAVAVIFLTLASIKAFGYQFSWPCPWDGESASVENVQSIFIPGQTGSCWNVTYSHRHYDFKTNDTVTHRFVIQQCD